MKQHELETGELAKRARLGDAESYTLLVRRYQVMAYGYAYARLGDLDLAEDAAQQAFITAWRSLGKLRQPERFGGWLRSIVYFECSHLLRARSPHLPLADEGQVSQDPHPLDRIESGEEFGRIFEAISVLPQAEREATILYYLHGHSQGDVAAFLNVPVTTINNRLRNARKFLRKELLDMTSDAFRNHQVPDTFASRIGEIIRAEGQFLEARFGPDQRPRLLNALTVTGESSEPVTTVEAIQFLDDDLVRCVTLTPEAVRIDTGMRVIDTGGTVNLPLNPAAIRQVLSSPNLDVAFPDTLETGIKVIDLLIPLPRHGRIALVGDMHAGKMVLVEELIHRLAGAEADITLYVFVQTPDEATAINALEYQASRNVSAIYLPVADASPDALADETGDLDAVITFSTSMAKQHLYPAIDPLQSTSRLLHEARLDPGHREVATRMRKALGKQGGNDNSALKHYLAQPFFVAEPFTGRAGTSIPLTEAIRESRDLLDTGDTA